MSLFLDGQRTWNDFLEYKLLNYEKLRNFDYGPNNKSSVSRLSPYISHRLFLEYELIKEIKNYSQIDKSKKFIEEIYWRIYWKGWMENRPKVWNDFILKKDYEYNKDDYNRAIIGKTHLYFFNSWVDELKKYNYLHNHTRMWFASTWIFNLGLPWQLGASFFFKYLYDGDAASNILSWRWVAGLHTKGKQYHFSPSNLKKFSNNRFNVEKIDQKPILLEEENELELDDEIYKYNMKKQSDYLILFENDMHAKTLGKIFKKYKKVFVILLTNEQRKIKISQEVYDFKKTIVAEFASHFKNVEIIDVDLFEKKMENIKQFDLIYPSIGDNNDFINRFKISNKKIIFNLVRDADLFAWKFAKKGFFKFKENIPKINEYIFKAC